jgi:phosphoribosylglycinamide formyltransferase-1
MKHIVIFASGSGSNAEVIINNLHGSSLIVDRIYCNNPKAGVIERAERHQIPVCLISKEDWINQNESNWYETLQNDRPDLIVLAGFLWKIPAFLIEYFPKKIINLHPSLLPKYGGKGMYGMNVHQAVLDNNEITTGITIHFVNSEYDEGGIIFQAEMYVSPSKTADSIAQRIHVLEHEHFSKVIMSLLLP